MAIWVRFRGPGITARVGVRVAAKRWVNLVSIFVWWFANAKDKSKRGRSSFWVRVCVGVGVRIGVLSKVFVV